jgi:hypothetical protein
MGLWIHAHAKHHYTHAYLRRGMRAAMQYSARSDEKVCHLIKGTHAWNFNSLFLTLFCIIQSSIDAKHSMANIFQNIYQIRPDIPSFQSFPVFVKSA